MIKLNNRHFKGAFIVFLMILLFTTYAVDRVDSKYFTPYSFGLFFACITMLYVSMIVIYRVQSIQWNLKHLLFLTGFIRLLLLFSEPNLSDDYFRYIWDGLLSKNGLNPFMHLPSEVIEWENARQMGFTKDLYLSFNSQNYYSVYPPINQFVYFVAASVGGSNVYLSGLTLRIFMILAELGSVFFMVKLLERFQIPIKNALLYILNPLIILEFTVNLHFEGMMVFFILGALYFLQRKRMLLSGVFWGMAICTKIIPIVFLPFLLTRYKLKHVIMVGGVAMVTVGLLFLPFWNPQIIPNIQDSLDKYFGFFYFNSGLIYGIREIGYAFTKTSITRELLPQLKYVFLIFVILYSLSFLFMKKKRPIVFPMFWTMLIYLVISGIIHPWYIGILIPLGILSGMWSGIVWGYLVVLSYSAYRSSDYQEDYWLIALEFVTLAIFLIWEMFWRRKSKLDH